MMAFVGIILLGTLIVLYEAPPLYRQGRYKDLLVFLILTVLGLTLAILILMDVPVGSPTAFIGNASSLLFKMFKKIARFFAGLGHFKTVCNCPIFVIMSVSEGHAPPFAGKDSTC